MTTRGEGWEEHERPREGGREKDRSVLRTVVRKERQYYMKM
jgi:hypothetical protein